MFFSSLFSFTYCGCSVFVSLTPIGMFNAPAINTSMTDPLSKVHPHMYVFNVESNVSSSFFFFVCGTIQSHNTIQYCMHDTRSRCQRSLEYTNFQSGICCFHSPVHLYTIIHVYWFSASVVFLLFFFSLI